MRKHGIRFSFLMVVALGLSCTEEIKPTPYTYTEIFSGTTSKTWNLKSIAFRNEGDPDWKLSDVCWSDDEYTFYRDDERKFEFKTGSRKCSPTEESFTITDTWSFSNATATLYFIIPLLSSNPLPFTVIDVDKNDLVVEIFFYMDGSQSYQIKFESDDF